MVARPGQFAQIKAPGYFLPRPLSICDWTPSRLIFLYKVIGGGTQALSQAHPGEHLEILAGLGNGFDQALAGESPLLVGGGLGAAPLYALARRLAVKGRVTVALGFQGARDVILAEDFAALGAKVLVTTVEGDAGQPGPGHSGSRAGACSLPGVRLRPGTYAAGGKAPVSPGLVQPGGAHGLRAWAPAWAAPSIPLRGPSACAPTGRCFKGRNCYGKHPGKTSAPLPCPTRLWAPVAPLATGRSSPSITTSTAWLLFL